MYMCIITRILVFKLYMSHQGSPAVAKSQAPFLKSFKILKSEIKTMGISYVGISKIYKILFQRMTDEHTL